jgi:hypothetical protein
LTHEGKHCEQCAEGHYEFSRYCGAYVCDRCGDHLGLAKCYCGFGIKSAYDRAELEGENDYDAEPYGYGEADDW